MTFVVVLARPSTSSHSTTEQCTLKRTNWEPSHRWVSNDQEMTTKVPIWETLTWEVRLRRYEGKKKKKDATGSRSQHSVGNEAHASARAEETQVLFLFDFKGHCNWIYFFCLVTFIEFFFSLSRAQGLKRDRARGRAGGSPLGKDSLGCSFCEIRLEFDYCRCHPIM